MPEKDFHDVKNMTDEELIDYLNRCEDFLQFYVAVNEIKLIRDRDGLSKLLEIICRPSFYFRYPNAIPHLSDSIIAEKVLCNNNRREFTEKDMQRRIIKEFSHIFPCMKLIGYEVPIDGIGRIDILAEYNDRPVIMELKVKRKSPNSQLFAYAKAYNNPILIGITEEKLPDNRKCKNIHYLIYSDLMEKGCALWK